MANTGVGCLGVPGQRYPRLSPSLKKPGGNTGSLKGLLSLYENYYNVRVK